VGLLQLLALVSLLIQATAFTSQEPARPGPTAQPIASPSPTPTPLPPPTVKIDAYRTAAGRIIGAAVTSDRAYTRLAHLTDHIGHRLSGSKSLERAIEWAISEMKRDGLENVRGEKVMVPHWVRGEESLEMLTPAPRKLTMLGLGNSIGTPAEGITAEAVVVRDFGELEKLGEGARGKIIV
jgi:carboxypeptidase Q